MTFGQIHIPEGADEALEWAATREFELRFKRMERQRTGVTQLVNETATALRKLNMVLAGDPSVPPPPKPRVSLPPAREV